MLTHLIQAGIQFFDTLYVDYISQHIQTLIDHIGQYETYTATFQQYLGGVYFIFGKPLCMYIITTFFIVFAIRLIMAIVMLVGQFIP